jgi:hypothetical protein
MFKAVLSNPASVTTRKAKAENAAMNKTGLKYLESRYNEISTQIRELTLKFDSFFGKVSVLPSDHVLLSRKQSSLNLPCATF